MKKLIFGLLGISLTLAAFYFLSFAKDGKRYVPRDQENQITISQTISGAAEWMALRRINLETGTNDVKDIDAALMQIEALRRSKNQGMNLKWENIGPTNTGGRVRAIIFDKSNPNIIYAAGVSGGLWKSTTAGNSWQQVIYAGDTETNNVPNLNISSMCQDAAGAIYFGTGEGFYMGYGTKSRGFEGAGIWKSTDGNTFTRLASTWSTQESKNTFIYVNKLVAHPTIPGKVYAATNQGLQVTSDGGQTWTNPILNVANNPIKEFAGCVDISSDGTYIIVDLGINVYVSHDSGATWTKVTGNSIGQLPLTSARTELAIAPSNKNVMYAMCSKADGSMLNVYRSDDGGLTWNIIGPGGSYHFNILGNQGTFNNVIAVFPDNEDQIICGGQYSLWSWGKNDGWNQLTYWTLPESSPRYVHADQHAITFHPTNPNIVLCGSDGGLHRSLDRGISWQTRNKYFNVTQFYAIGIGPDKTLIGGTQDNGTLLYDPTVSTSTGTSYEFSSVSGGDGGYCAISNINPKIVFSTVYYGSLYRSDEGGANMASPYSARVGSAVSGIGSETGGHAFVTPIALWESFYDENSIDYVYKVAPRDLAAGEVVEIESNVPDKFFYVTLNAPVAKDDTVWVKDTYQSILAVGFNGSVWVTRDALSMRKDPYWMPVIQFPNEVAMTMEWSADGDILYVATQVGQNSNLYRVKGFKENRTIETMDVIRETYNLQTDKIATFSNRSITSIAVDPEFAGNVIVTLGNYGSSNFIYYSTSANVDPAVASGTGSFVSKQGNLPAMPAYCAVILWNDSRKVLVGTEFGLYSTNDITAASPVWNDENQNGMDYVAVYSLRQQIHRNGWIHELNSDSGVRNHGYIYAGTHGRGIFVCKDFGGPTSVPQNITEKPNSNINVFPNPASEYTHINVNLEQSTNIEIAIYDASGKVVDVLKYNNLNSGRHSLKYNVSGLKGGIYILRMKDADNISTTKLIVK
jgi:photosystem II stability/assembly factor-like uncharacterized protein